MDFWVILGVVVAAFVFIMFFTDIGGDYSKKTDAQLLQLYPFALRNTAANPGQDKAREKLQRLEDEMKKRGLKY